MTNNNKKQKVNTIVSKYDYEGSKEYKIEQHKEGGLLTLYTDGQYTSFIFMSELFPLVEEWKAKQRAKHEAERKAEAIAEANEEEGIKTLLLQIEAEESTRELQRRTNENISLICANYGR